MHDKNLDNTDFISEYSLAGKMLIANPYHSFGGVFDQSIIIIASHESFGALGLVVNKPLPRTDVKKIFKMYDKAPGDLDYLNTGLGGHMDFQRVFVIHKQDGYSENELNNALFCLGDIYISSNNYSMNFALEQGRKKTAEQLPYQVILGYTGWLGNQLEDEISQNYWLISDIDSSIVFAKNNDSKWDNGLKKIGVGHGYFGSQMGYC
jgi:putative transcriptional regulator